MDEVIAGKHIQALVRPDSSGRTAPRPGWIDGRYSWMRTVLASEHGKGLYRKRMQMIEPVFGHTKHNRLITRVHRWRMLGRGVRKLLPACPAVAAVLQAQSR